MASWQKELAKNPQVAMLKQMVKGHQAALAALSPEERKGQARSGVAKDLFAPRLAPVGVRVAEGRPQRLQVRPA